jgi:hypothetical protein
VLSYKSFWEDELETRRIKMQEGRRKNGKRRKKGEKEKGKRKGREKREEKSE